MIPNINQFTEQLRMMPDQALQRVAQMYKQDPYILPMVIAEDMARKKMRMAAQAQMAQPQPKVADQAIMSMGQQPQAAPGIAALQAPNMQNMADGGIAGYADDMDFADSMEPVVRMADGGVARYQGSTESLVRLRDPDDMLDTFYSQAMPKSGETAAERKARRAKERELEEAAEAEQRPLARLLRAVGSGESKLYKALYPTQEAILSRQQGREIGPVEAAYRDPRRAALDVPGAPTGAPAPRTEPSPEKETRTAADVVRQPAPVPAAPAAPVVQAPPAYAAPTPEATAAGIAALSKAPNEETAKAYAELRKLYEPEERELAQRRGQRGAEALLRAGLAMMSGTSPHAAVNIGKGATEGLNAYQEAQRYDDQAARALRQSQITMRMAERQEQIGNRRDAVTLFNQAQQQQQAAVSSAQQAQQIKQSGEYQQGSLAIMQQNANSNAKLVQARIKALDAPRQQQERMMAEYGKIQKQVMADLSKDVAYTTETDPAKKEQIFRSRINMAIANNPFLANTLFSSTPTGKVRDLEDTGDEKD
jgi:hypothetical protein